MKTERITTIATVSRRVELISLTGQIAAGLLASPSYYTNRIPELPSVAVDIAKDILAEVDRVCAVESEQETSGDSCEEPAEAQPALHLDASCVGKRYLSRGGRIAIIKAYKSDRTPYPIRGRFEGGRYANWTVEGRHVLGKMNDSDLVEEVK